MSAGVVDPQLLELFAPIARDLERAGLRAKLRATKYATATYMWPAALYVNGEYLGIVHADPGATVEQRLRSVAALTQDLVLEHVRRGPHAVVWPRCLTGHDHPMEIDRAPGPPCWVCPTDRDHRVLIGGGQAVG